MNQQQLFWQMLKQSLVRRGVKVALALLAVMVGTAAAATLLNLTFDVERKMNRELRTYGANLVVIPRFPESHLSESWVEVERLSGTDKVIGSAPYLYATGTIQADPSNEAVIVAGVRFNSVRQVSPYWHVQGEWARDDNTDAGMIGSQLAQRLGLQVGDRIQLAIGDGSWKGLLRITGIVTTGESEDEQVFMSLSTLQHATGLKAQISLLALSVMGGLQQVQATAREIEQRITGVEARPLRQVAQSEAQVLSKVKWVMFVLTAIILITSALCVMTTMMALVMERHREIGLMKALGAQPRQILGLLLSEASVLALVGGLAGFAIGVIGSRLIGLRLFQTGVSPRPETIPLTLALALIVCWLAAYAPLKRALTIEPASALKGE
ncbi:MAG: FtsX-like permease family protein [Acidobacteriota bacterium]|nr:ABC transporter permease [Blastocatellia bacterium]MDW8238394.1 FtsX-like permease family protein [Acidobacteriota bacterium]